MQGPVPLASIKVLLMDESAGKTQIQYICHMMANISYINIYFFTLTQLLHEQHIFFLCKYKLNWHLLLGNTYTKTLIQS